MAVARLAERAEMIFRRKGIVVAFGGYVAGQHRIFVSAK
jgi:hypothetical protein